MRYRILKPIFCFILALVVIWSVSLKRSVFQKLFGTSTNKELQISDNEIYMDLQNANNYC